MQRFDAILIPGGGLTAQLTLPPYVQARLDQAITYEADLYVALGAGTTRKPVPQGRGGLPVYESLVAAEYLVEKGIPQTKIIAETLSYDTIAGFVFARLLHLDPLGMSDLRIITSRFHLARAEASCRWIFGIEPSREMHLSFESTPNIGISPEALEARVAKERASLDVIEELASEITTLKELHRWLHTRHGAYAWFLRHQAFQWESGKLVETY